ncbi:FecCD family ABC transporter permease [Leucobacter japonicus]|uniref:FecCD family ABC transporter permease n=1 Tax=Leucobacter japonicus TaxID=1461259 RepID=UPI0006A7C31A|nr:iron chelate uptake ABC transporter family permease subunit [Leucobacter japonicus]
MSSWRSRGDSVSLRWHRRTLRVTIVLALCLVPLGVAVMMTGTFTVDWAAFWAAVTGEGDAKVLRVLEGIRLPRYIGGIVVGAALGLSGAVFQTISRNPLGSPDIIGFVTGAATGAIVAILVFEAPALMVSAAAVVSGVFTAVIVALLTAGRRGQASAGGYRLILVGIGVGALLAALNDLLLTRSQRDDAIAAQIWLVGTLNARGWDEVLPTVIAVVVLVPILLVSRHGLAALELGDDMARQTGAAVGAIRLTTVAIAVALTAFATATAGPISFVALAAPQLIARISRSPSLPLLGSAVMGAVLLVTADLFSQYLPFSLSAPVGLVTGVLGGGYLLWMLSRGR